MSDLLHGARRLLRRPSFLMLAGMTLALGIGACVSVFALIDTVVLAKPPFPNADRLVVLGKSSNPSWSMISPRQYQLLEELPGVERLGASFAAKDVNIAGEFDPDLVTAWPVDAGLLPTLGVELVVGRNFSVEEDRQNGPRAAILGHAFWQRHFNGDTSVIGRDIMIDGASMPVIGVLPADFRLNGSPDVLLPLALPAESRDLATNLLAFARLAPGVSIEQVSASLDTRLHSHAEELEIGSSNWRPSFYATTLAANMGAAAKPVLLLFFACALCVLLLVAVNLSNLMLLRAVANRHASAVRSALGASTARMALPALGEGLLIGLVGAVAGLAFAAFALSVSRAWLPTSWLAASSSALGWRAYLFAMLAALLVAALAVMLGVWRGSRSNDSQQLVAGARVGQSVGTQRFGRILVIAQASLATLLLASSAMLAHSLWKLSQVELGFDAEDVLVFRANPSRVQYADVAALHRFSTQLQQRLSEESGARDVAITTTLPIGSQLNVSVILPDGQEAHEAPQYRAVSPNSFSTLRIPVLAGRDFTDADRRDAEPVVIVSAAFERLYFNGNALGRSFKVHDSEDMPMPTMRIVGVVGDVRQFGPREAPPPTFYVPLAQVPDDFMAILRQFVALNVAIRVQGNAAAFAEQTRAAMRELDASLGIAALRLLERDVEEATQTQRTTAVLVSIFAVLAMLLASVGLYSVTAVSVNARQREFGVRAALGASTRRILGGVIGRGLMDVAIGLAVGLGLTLVAARVMGRFLYEVGALDPLAWVATWFILMLAGLMATALPALRAARVQPMHALRSE